MSLFLKDIFPWYRNLRDFLCIYICCSTAIWLALCFFLSLLSIFSGISMYVLCLSSLYLRLLFIIRVSDLIMMFFGRILFMFLVLSICYFIWTCEFIVFINFGKLLTLFLQILFLFSSSKTLLKLIFGHLKLPTDH